ncbi:MAG: LysR family transcriptional regulator [Paracoccaceae bacterium]
MDWKSVKFDWNKARAFLVTAEEGSFSAAARALGMAQPTLGRQVSALEDDLGVVLFQRAGRGLTLTQSGLELMDHVRAMGEAATRISLTASGQSQSVIGTVSISASEVTSAFVLPGIVTRLRQTHPGITIEVVATNSLSDLRRREADIAVRSMRPTDPDLVARKLKSGKAELFAAQSYLDRIGQPRCSADLTEAEFVGFDDNGPFLDGLNDLGLNLTSSNFQVRSGTHLIQWELVKQGAGIGVMMSEVGDAEPQVERAAPWLPAFEYDIWLVAHRELNTSRRIRLVFDWLATEMRKL